MSTWRAQQRPQKDGNLLSVLVACHPATPPGTAAEPRAHAAPAWPAWRPVRSSSCSAAPAPSAAPPAALGPQTQQSRPNRGGRCPVGPGRRAGAGLVATVSCAMPTCNPAQIPVRAVQGVPAGVQRTSPPKARSVHVSSSSWPACGLPLAAAAAAVVSTLLAALLHVQTDAGCLCSRSQAANRRRRLGPRKRAPTKPLPACCTGIVLDRHV